MKKFIPPLGLGFLGVLLFFLGLSINPKVYKETPLPVGRYLPICQLGDQKCILYDGHFYPLPPGCSDSSTFLIPLLNPTSMGLEGRRLAHLQSQDQFVEYRLTTCTDETKKTERTILTRLGISILVITAILIILIIRKKPPL